MVTAHALSEFSLPAESQFPRLQNETQVKSRPAPPVNSHSSLTGLIREVGLEAAVPREGSSTNPVPTRPGTMGSPCGHLA